MLIKANGIQQIKVEVKVEDVLRELEEKLFPSRGGYIGVKDNKVIRETDISRHGSPFYMEEILSDNEVDVEAYKAIVTLLNYCRQKDLDKNM